MRLYDNKKKMFRIVTRLMHSSEPRWNPPFRQLSPLPALAHMDRPPPNAPSHRSCSRAVSYPFLDAFPTFGPGAQSGDAHART